MWRRYVPRRGEVLLAALLAAMLIAGYSLEKTESLWGSFGLPLFVVLWIAATTFLSFALHVVDCALDAISHGTTKNAPLPFGQSIKNFFVMLACWTPYLVCAFPGNVHGDFLHQLLQYLGVTTMTTHHPVLMTQCFGVLYELGSRLFGEPVGGIATVVAFQSLILLGVFCVSLHMFCKWGVPRSVRRGMLLFYALNPLFPMYASFCIKDTISAALSFLFLLMLADKVKAVRKARHFSRHARPRFMPLALVGLLASLTRNNVVFIVVAALFTAIILYPVLRRGLISALALVVVAYGVFSFVVVPRLGIKSGSLVEALSVPVQQTAAHIKYYPDDITEEERRVIVDSAAISNLEELADRYTYKISDPVKSLFSSATKRQLMSYLLVWFRMSLRHPLFYLNVFLHGNYGYWYPLLTFSDVKWGNSFRVLPNDYVDELIGIGFRFDGRAQALRSLSCAVPELHDYANGIIEMIGNLPVLGLLLKPAFYSWIVLIFAGWSFTRRRKCATVLAVPALLTIAVCCVSPDYANMRYALPLAFYLPVVVSASLFGERERVSSAKQVG